jgi:hypothetical protein
MTANASFPIGDSVVIKLTIYVDNTLTNPTTTTFTVEEPDGTNNTPSTVNDSTGVRSCVFVPDQSGYHRWKGAGTSPAAFVREGTFYVHTSGIV